MTFLSILILSAASVTAKKTGVTSKTSAFDLYASETPQEIQKRYPEYSVLVEDLVLTNKRMIEYKDLMGKIAFNR